MFSVYSVYLSIVLVTFVFGCCFPFGKELVILLSMRDVTFLCRFLLCLFSRLVTGAGFFIVKFLLFLLVNLNDTLPPVGDMPRIGVTN